MSSKVLCKVGDDMPGSTRVSIPTPPRPNGFRGSDEAEEASTEAWDNELSELGVKTFCCKLEWELLSIGCF